MVLGAAQYNAGLYIGKCSTAATSGRFVPANDYFGGLTHSRCCWMAQSWPHVTLYLMADESVCLGYSDKK
jgi:hypothetical protein